MSDFHWSAVRDTVAMNPAYVPEYVGTFASDTDRFCVRTAAFSLSSARGKLTAWRDCRQKDLSSYVLAAVEPSYPFMV